ncbi:MAG: PQQ-binding-like beta-propeller repeat protein, partial [Candidatus Azambacteria bacterium]|nr:PQQ-binding-like beta-propeller repeat protein [Candidatus Azambacteria bacterium]
FESSPLIYRGVVYVGCHYGFIHAVDLKTGKKRWRFLTGWDIDESIPAVSGGLVFIGGTDGRAYALRID